MIPQLELYDGCLIIIYLFVIYIASIIYVQKKRKTEPIYRFFIPALSLKIVGGLVYALYHIYVYKGGDTFAFFDAAQDLKESVKIFDLKTWGVYYNSYDYDTFSFTKYQNFLSGKDVFFTVKIVSFISSIAMNSYFTTTILFSFFSFLGLWKFFLVFNRLYSLPLVRKYLFIICFCIPTMLLWSSGVLKDTVTIGAIGWMVYAVANIFVFKNKKRFSSIVIILIASYFIFLLKPYLIYILYPAFFIWIQSNIKKSIKNKFIRNLTTPLLSILIIISLYFVLSSLSSSAGKYSVDNLESTLKGFHSWHGHLTETTSQSGYSLGDMDYTAFGVLQKLPASIIVTFFRPYPWEIRNIPTLLGAIEGLFFLTITLYILFKAKLNFFKSIRNNKEVLFLLAFAIPFAFVVGLSSYNFGALSRYKIPAELFYLTALVLIYSEKFQLKSDK